MISKNSGVIYLNYIDLEEVSYESAFKSYFNLLSPICQRRNLAYRKLHDKKAHLLGRILLLDLLSLTEQEEDISSMKFSNFGRPFLSDNFDFNISHSGNYVLCVLSFNQRVGVDIQEWCPIEYSEFSTVLSDEDLRRIRDSISSDKEFFKIWTLKESIVKANGQGLSIPLKSIIITPEFNICENDIWFSKEIYIADGYSVWVSSDVSNYKISITNLRIENFGKLFK